MNYIEKQKELAKRDAKRYMEAKLNYGKGAGTQRKLIDAELKDKFKDEIYKAAFEAALAGIDEARVVEKIRKKKGVQRTVEGARKGIRTVRRAENLYYRNKYWIDRLIGVIFGD